MNINNYPRYTLTENKSRIDVSSERREIAEKIDKDKDFNLKDEEIKDYLIKEDILRDTEKYAVDEKQIMDDFKLALQNKPLPQKSGYHSYEQVITQLKDLEKKYPNLAKTVSIGKTTEGRDIMAIKISKDAPSDTSSKPGFLITGCHHAREWMAMEAPLGIPTEILENYGKDEAVTKRVDSAEIWVVPLVNPDGYEYSRNGYSFWRKNRNPVKVSDVPPSISSGIKPASKDVLSYGVDLNRNYYDGNPEHMEYYRPEGDTAESTNDDFGWSTSDNPRSDTYRGPRGASEKEVQAILDLWMNKKNIKGIVNHHSYGKMILYPWGVSTDAVPNKETYQEIGKKMAAAIKDDKYIAKPSSGLYPASGDPDDFAQLNGRLSVTIEIGSSFQPKDTEIGPTTKRIYNANMAFLDYIIEKDKKEENIPEKKEEINIPNISI